MIDPDLTDKFFLQSDSTQLVRIYQWARARYAAPWAVFFVVLLRAAASIGPHVQLPGVIGGRASLNLLCAFVSFSGGGKGISDKVGRLAWPTAIVELPIGSGEGIAATFMPPTKPDENSEPTPRVIFNCSEIDILTGLATRQGATILGTLKAFAMGELLGSTNASKANSRNVPAHSYRGCLSVGAQPGHTGIIFDDTTGGTPQRFLWAPTVDPTMPADCIGDPAPLDTDIPMWAPDAGGVVEIGYGPPEITETIIAAHLARQRGDGDALDGHWMLTRCKVAALLAIIHHRSVVSEQDWALSEIAMQVSDTTRQTLVDHATRTARAKIRDRAVARATGEDFYDASRLETVKRSLLRMLDRDGEQPAGDLRKRLGRREKRELFDQAISLLEAHGLAVSRAGSHNGQNYTLWSPVTNAVTPQNSSSERVTKVVTREHPIPTEQSDIPSSAVSGTPDPDPAPSTDPTLEAPVESPKPVACGVCYIELPTSATDPVCADCADAPAPVRRASTANSDVGHTAVTDAARGSATAAASDQQTRDGARIRRTAPQIRAAMKRIKDGGAAS